MAALGILVPSVQVRILVPQHKKLARSQLFALRHPRCLLSIEGRTPQTPLSLRSESEPGAKPAFCVEAPLTIPRRT